MDRADIAVPASIGNLGPGFDALSAALQLYLRVRIVDVRPSQPDSLETVFTGGAQVPASENGIERAFRLARSRTGVAAPGLRIEASSDIPVRGGLGSSAAAAVAGLRLYASVAAPLTEGDLLALATELEGHPDNAAACILGGVVVSCRHDDGRVTARASRWPERLRIVIATPEAALGTKEARAVLPAAVPLRDAVFNLQRALLLIRALETEEYGDLREAFRDRWHQPARTPLVPGLREVLELDDPSVLGVCLSGSGPSVVAFALAGREAQAADALRSVYRRIQMPVAIRMLSAHQPASAGVAPLTLEREKLA